MLASGKTADAAKAFEIAINKIDKESPQYRFLQLKVDALEAAK